MDIFPIVKSCFNEKDEEFEEILGYQVLAPDGSILATGDTPEEVSESALVAMFMEESNPNASSKLKRRRRLLDRKAV